MGETELQPITIYRGGAGAEVLHYYNWGMVLVSRVWGLKGAWQYTSFSALNVLYKTYIFCIFF